ncbi:hypothetical protein HRbin30_01554 [bacterium HR30]|nr:hypothetical protein HRbin30_01554 [bacterium HR30]
MRAWSAGVVIVGDTCACDACRYRLWFKRGGCFQHNSARCGAGTSNPFALSRTNASRCFHAVVIESPRGLQRCGCRSCGRLGSWVVG